MNIFYKRSFTSKRPPFCDSLIPSDKSISHRVLLLSILEEDDTVLENVNMGGAVIPLLDAFRKLGIRVFEASNGVLKIGHLKKPNPNPIKKTPYINLGSSSTAARLLIGLLVGKGISAVIDGDASLRPRPFDWIVDPLRELGANIEYLRKEGELPIQLNESQLHTGNVQLSVGSAQALSALLFAGYAGNIELKVHQKVQSRDHTQRLMAFLGAKIQNDGHWVHFSPGIHKPLSHYRVPLDPSAVVYPISSYLLKQGITPSIENLVIRNVCLNETRIGFLRLLIELGADISFSNIHSYFNEDIGDIVILAGCALRNLRPWVLDDEFTFHAMIDEIPLAVALASQINGKSFFKGLGELTFKETNRITATQNLLNDFGIQIAVEDDNIIVEGKQLLAPKDIIRSFGDHRLAMTAATICGGLHIQTVIEHGSCYQTSYPHFIQSMNLLSVGQLKQEVNHETACV